jgi:hypothetical protein
VGKGVGGWVDGRSWEEEEEKEEEEGGGEERRQEVSVEFVTKNMADDCA